MKNQNTKFSKQQGFTLIEILVALVLFAAIVAAVVPQVIQQGEKGKIDSTGITMTSLENALNLYKLQYGTKKLQDVSYDTLIAQKFLDKIPTDGWGNDLYFELDGANIIIISDGPDAISDTEDDVTNQDSEE